MLKTILKNTLNSIINASTGFKNIELILVDDFSTDNSKKIIDKYSKKYNNILPFYSNKNHGHPIFVRKIGLKHATSDHIMFRANDNEIDKYFCKKLYETIINENADIVYCDTHILDPIEDIKKYKIY